MKFKAFLLSILLAGSTTVMAQEWEVGGFLGLSQYQGDLGADPADNPVSYFIKGNRPAGGVFGRYNFNPNIAFRGGLNIGLVAGYDKYNSAGTSREARNLSFHSHIIELSGTFEWNILKYIPGSRKYKWTPYLYAGIGAFHFSPKAWYLGERYNLGKLNTGVPDYSNIAVAIPFGGGLKFNVKKDWTLGIETGIRLTTTDYIDHVSGDRAIDKTNLPAPDAYFVGGLNPGSKRGNEKYRDSYLFVGFTLTKTLRPYRCR